MIWTAVTEYFDFQTEFQPAISSSLCFLNYAYDFLLLLLFFFHQHVDDHSIIMADQTVIKKGEFIPNL